MADLSHECTLEGFKREAKKFLDRVHDQSLSDEQVAAARSSFNLSYLHLQISETREIHEAFILLQLVYRELWDIRPGVSRI